MGKLIQKTIPHTSQPQYKCGFNRSLHIPRANFLLNSFVGGADLISGNILNVSAGTPIFTDVPKHGKGIKVWRGRCYIPEIPQNNNHAILCVFRLNATSDGVIICGSGGIYGPQMRMVSGVLQYRPPATGTANVPATTTMTAGETYVVFGYSWGTASTDREIWINGQNVSGTKVNSGIITAINRVCVGENPSFVTVTPDADIIMGAVWSGYRFSEQEAKFLSSNPWSVFEPQKRRVFVQSDLTPVENDSVLLWNLTGNVESNSNIYWNLINDVSNDTNINWNIYTNINNDLNLLYDLITELTVVNKDYEIEWNQSGFVTNDSVSIWNVLNNVQNDSVSLWNLLNNVQNDSNIEWNITQDISNDYEIIWNQAGQVANNLQILFNIQSFVENEIQTNWNILNFVENDSNLLWNLRNSLSNDLSLLWNSGAETITDYEIIWNQAGGVENSLELAYNIINNVQSDLSLSWRVINTTQNSIVLRWNLISDLTYEGIPTGTVTFIIQKDEITFE